MPRRKTMQLSSFKNDQSTQKLAVVALIILDDFSKKRTFIIINKFTFKLIIKNSKFFNIV